MVGERKRRPRHHLKRPRRNEKAGVWGIPAVRRARILGGLAPPVLPQAKVRVHGRNVARKFLLCHGGGLAARAGCQRKPQQLRRQVQGPVESRRGRAQEADMQNIPPRERQGQILLRKTRRQKIFLGGRALCGAARRAKIPRGRRLAERRRRALLDGGDLRKAHRQCGRHRPQKRHRSCGHLRSERMGGAQ